MLNDKRELGNTVCRPSSTALSTRAGSRWQAFTTQAIASTRCLPSQVLQAPFRKSTYSLPCQSVRIAAKPMQDVYASRACQCEYSNCFCFLLGLAAALAGTHVQPATGTPLLLHVCSCCSLCMLLHGVICFVYCHLQCLCQLNANATQMLQLHQHSQETLLPLQRVKWLFKGYVSLLPQPDKVLPQLLQASSTCMPLPWLPLLPSVAG